MPFGDWRPHSRQLMQRSKMAWRLQWGWAGDRWQSLAWHNPLWQVQRSDLGESCRLSREPHHMSGVWEGINGPRHSSVLLGLRQDCLSYSAAFINSVQSGTRTDGRVWTRQRVACEFIRVPSRWKSPTSCYCPVKGMDRCNDCWSL